MALLEVRGLNKSFEKHGEKIHAVTDVSLSLEQGECLGLVGESGCGKSTTANIIARLLKEDAGDILFNGRKISGTKLLKPVGRELQMIFQNPQDSFDSHDTVVKGVMQGAMSYGIWDKRVLRDKVLEAFGFVGLKQSYADKRMNEISGGECQRAAIARAIICAPKLIICDEATSALDVLVQAQVVSLLKKLKSEKNIALIFITHDLPLATALCDRVAVMHSGRIIEIGDARSVLQNPVQPETRSLIKSVFSGLCQAPNN